MGSKGRGERTNCAQIISQLWHSCYHNIPILTLKPAGGVIIPTHGLKSSSLCLATMLGNLTKVEWYGYLEEGKVLSWVTDNGGWTYYHLAAFCQLTFGPGKILHLLLCA